MKRLWAPWRKIYVAGGGRTKGCFFCNDLRHPPKHDAKNLLLHRSRHSFILLNRFPYTNGHLMIVPKRHVASPDRLTDKERLDFLKMLDVSLAVLKKALKPHAFNVGMNLGREGGAGVPGHIHLHVVPRWKGDTNFMPVLTGHKVISVALAATYEELRRALRRVR